MVEIALLLVFFSLIQSIFGMGLLVFGTPTLVLMGYSFTKTLWLLLSSSVALSAIQSFESSRLERTFLHRFLFWCLPVLIIALSSFLYWSPTFKFEMMLGLIMLFFAVLRMVSAVPKTLAAWVERHERGLMMLMGLILGTTNMGGSVLALITSSRFSHKQDVRGAVWHCSVDPFRAVFSG